MAANAPRIRYIDGFLFMKNNGVMKRYELDFTRCEAKKNDRKKKPAADRQQAI